MVDNLTRGMLLLLIISSWADCSHRTGDVCETLQGDNRHTPAKMNQIPGTETRLFIDLTVPMRGYVSSISFYALREGPFYVSFWKQIRRHIYALEAKLEVFAQHANETNIVLPQEHIFVERGWILGIHYSTGLDRDLHGIVSCEHDAINRTENVGLHTVRSHNASDNNWKIGKKRLRFDTVRYDQAIALHVSICGCASGFQLGPDCDTECSNGTFGPNCAYDCSGNCAHGDDCNKGTGWCDEGCKSGYEPPLCQGHAHRAPWMLPTLIVLCVLVALLLLAFVLVFIFMYNRHKRKSRRGVSARLSQGSSEERAQFRRGEDSPYVSIRGRSPVAAAGRTVKTSYDSTYAELCDKNGQPSPPDPPPREANTENSYLEVF